MLVRAPGKARFIQRAYRAYTLGLRAFHPKPTMSNQPKQDAEEPYAAHRTTNGPASMYLEAENPNVPADKLASRFQAAKEMAPAYGGIRPATKGLPRIQADISCPECNDSDVFYTDKFDIARCDGCGLQIVETGETAAEFMGRIEYVPE